ncbi:MAG: glycosyltransferase involved in cell wall biosynthesis [Sphingobacteriales bacterium]|jgi:glycosyltransferase involved in cell wall biosynthesis
MNISVIIPAFNETTSIGKVINAIPKDLVNEIIVVNNGSTDDTAQVAENAGATVLMENRKGYGSACLCGINYLAQKSQLVDVVVFIDGDYSDYPEQLPLLINPIKNNNVDMVIGSRALGKRQSGSMMPQQIFGNWLATTLIKLLYGVTYTDLGPFRAIKFSRLLELDMKDTTYGWTVEMQVKAAKRKFFTTEVAVDYRQRIGVSKITGTVKGTILAGYKIITTIFLLR